MEEDDPTPHALPRWVELEYKVSTNGTRPLPFPTQLLTDSGTHDEHLCLTHSPPPPMVHPETLFHTYRENPRTHWHATNIAHAHARRSGRLHRLYAPLARSQRVPVRRPRSLAGYPRPFPRSHFSCYRACRMSRARRTIADASAQHPARARVPARS
jgi:hypothetical protein